MTAPRWWSQPFPPAGAITSEGIRNQLGRPPVDPLTVFVRETAQNSWDARLTGQPVRYELAITHVSPVHRPVWQRMLTPPADIGVHLGVGRVLREPDLRILTVSDRGTKGLGGPTRADRLSDGPRDWVSFVLNVGEKRDTTFGGGTYGYGKAVLYRLSTVGTVLVHTRCLGRGGAPISRLIGVALGNSFDLDTRRESRPHTGRHWWGHVEEDHVEPLHGDEADRVARALGLRPFEGEETGTTLVVLDPDLEDHESDDDAGRHLAETVSWHTWPLMLPERGEERLLPSVLVDGREVAVPDPARTHPLGMFVEAYRRAKEPKATVLMCGRPSMELGTFALTRRVVLPMAEKDQRSAAAFAGVPEQPHHVCLMRSPELVVKYVEGPKPFSTNTAYAGVFRARDHLDDVYAAAEPPTHDNWVHEQLHGYDRTYVRTTFIRIKEQLGEFRRAGGGIVARTDRPLGAASTYLGGLIAAGYAEQQDGNDDDLGGRGLRVGRDANDRSERRGSTGPMRSGRPARAVLVGEARLEPGDRDAPLIVQTVRVDGDDVVRLDAVVGVVTPDGREAEPPAGGSAPEVHEWRTETATTGGRVCVVRAPAQLELWVRPVPDTITEISVTATTVSP